MRPCGIEERKHSAADLLLLLATVILALSTWLYLSDTTGVPVWKSYIAVTVTLFLALAALTRHPHWAAAIRVLTGVWLVAVPYLLSFQTIAPASWTYQAIGVAVTALAVAGMATRHVGRVRMAV